MTQRTANPRTPVQFRARPPNFPQQDQKLTPPWGPARPAAGSCCVMQPAFQDLHRFPHRLRTFRQRCPASNPAARASADIPMTDLAQPGVVVHQHLLNAISGNRSLTARKVRGGHEREARCPPASKPLKKLVSLPGELLRYFGHRGFGVLISAPYRSLRVRPLSRHADQQVMTRGAITGAGAGGRSPSRSTWSWGRPRRYGSPGRLTR